MVTDRPADDLVEGAPPASASRSWRRRFGADLAYVFPGFFLSLFAFIALVAMFAVSLATLVIWVGALLLPLTLLLASGFAELSRARLRHWGVALPAPRYRARGTGLIGSLQWLRDPRRWLDLAFETLIAFPLRTFTFIVALTWAACALGGLTWWSWGFYLPDGEPRFPGRVIEALTNGAAADALTHSYAFESGCYAAVGILFTVTLPFIIGGLARLDASVTGAALGALPLDERAVPEPLYPSGATAGSEHPQARAAGRIGARLPRSAVAPGTGATTTPAATPVVSADGWAWICAGFAAIIATAVGWPVLAALYGVPVAVAMVLVVGQAAALPLAVLRPWIGIALMTLAAAGTGYAALWQDPALPWPWPVVSLILQALLVLLIALRAPWPLALAAWALPQGVPAALVLSTAPAFPGIGDLILCLVLSAASGVVGVLLRLWVRSDGELREERRRRERISSEHRELAERNRVAQELHDVVAHSMSVISVQATTAKYRLDGVSDETSEEFASIAASSRQALSEMRGLLAVLRAPDRAPELAPQPGYADIPELVEATRRSGAEIALRRGGGADGSVTDAIGLVAYRIVQEALSNAVRHAPGAAIEVALEARDGLLEIAVRNGAANAELAAHPAPGAGLGLTGVKDRVAACGGTVSAARIADGGYLVRASLPLTADA